MKTYKVMRTYLPIGEAGTQKQMPDDKFTRDMLAAGIIAELKVEQPIEKKARKPRAKKAD